MLLASKAFKADNNEVVRGGSGGRTDETVDSSKSKKLKNTMSEIQIRIGPPKEIKFFTFSIKKVFNRLKQAFIKALILRHYDPECHIQIEINASSYVISRVLSQLTFDHLSFDQSAIG